MNKKYVILFFVTVIVIASFITIQLPPKERPITLEEVKEKILLTKRIGVEKQLAPNNEIINYPDIKEENIKEIVELLSTMYSVSGWDSLVSRDTYCFKFFDETGELLTTVEVDDLPNSSLWRIKGDEYRFAIDLYPKSEKALKELLESEYDIILP